MTLDIMTTVCVIATSITLLDTLSERVYIDDIVNQLVHSMDLFKVTYNGWGKCNFNIAFVFADNESEAIRNVKDDDRTDHFNNVKCEEVIKSGVIYNKFDEDGV